MRKMEADNFSSNIDKECLNSISWDNEAVALLSRVHNCDVRSIMTAWHDGSGSGGGSRHI